ncbi:MAG: c-type cytochrome [Limisphaerales bacterium]
MRELIAKFVCVFALGLVVTLAFLFATRQNPEILAERADPPAAHPTVPVAEHQPIALLQGVKIFEEQRCSLCHSIAGVGSRRSPLDGVGDRRQASELRDWITGSGSATNGLAPSTIKRKQRYHEISPTEMEALVQYLASLKTSERPQDADQQK